MLNTHEQRPLPRSCFALPRARAARIAGDTPMQNQLLAALTPESFRRLLPHLEAVELPLDWVVYDAHDKEKYVYFITAGTVSQGYVMENGETAGFALTGTEGVVGIASILGGDNLPSQANVLSAGRAYRIGIGPLMAEFELQGSLQHLLLRYVLCLIAEIGQVAACNRHHTIEQQFCRHLLSGADRAASNQLATTQGRIADVLGVRRESVSEVAARLRKAGAITCGRGHITVLDRALLASHACECHGVTRDEYDHLLPQYREARAA